MSCRCGVSYCYVCGGRGKGCSCDSSSYYLESDSNRAAFEAGGFSEGQNYGNSRGALVEFHRRRTAAFVQLAKAMLATEDGTVWARLQAAEPQLLELRLFERAISLKWDEPADAAALLLCFGTGGPAKKRPQLESAAKKLQVVLGAGGRGNASATAAVSAPQV